MKIILAYHSGWHKFGIDFADLFKQLGHTVSVYPIESAGTWRWYVPSFMKPKAVRDLSKRADLIVEIDGSGLHHIKTPKEKSVLWAHDIYREDKKKFFKQIQKDFKKVFVAQSGHVRDLKNAEWLPLGANTDVWKPIKCLKDWDVAFVGNLTEKIYPKRYKYVLSISSRFYTTVSSRCFASKANEMMNQAKIGFNCSHSGDLNFRVFETMASGTMLMTDPSQGLLDLFEDGKHLIVYNSQAELLDKVDYYLKHDTEREKIAQAGYEEVIKNHTMIHRLRRITNER